MEMKQLIAEATALLVPIYGERETSNLLRILKEDILHFKSKNFATEEISIWQDAIIRLQHYEPIQYITGIAWFFNQKLKVAPSVLIPRPETEELTDLIKKKLNHQESKKILDIGTGSGCIAIALKTAGIHHEVHALDLSEEALSLAMFNADEYGLKITWHQGDILNPVLWDLLPPDLDIIVSNPPYITISEMDLMSKSTLEYEPTMALFALDDGLVFYRAIAEFGITHLVIGGNIFVEINEFLAEETVQIFKEFGYSEIQLLKDMSGKNRFISCVR